jgi:hypothetical protein
MINSIPVFLAVIKRMFIITPDYVRRYRSELLHMLKSARDNRRKWREVLRWIFYAKTLLKEARAFTYLEDVVAMLKKIASQYMSVILDIKSDVALQWKLGVNFLQHKGKCTLDATHEIYNSVHMARLLKRIWCCS